MSISKLLSVCIVVAAVILSLSNSNRHVATRSQGRGKVGDVVVGKVVSIADGDTVTVLDDDDTQHRIRLFGMDAPEKDQAYGRRSKENLADKIFGKRVRVEVVDVDRYGREVGRIYLDDRFINMEQVEDGYAWRYTYYDKQHEFDAAEADARQHRRGLWADSHPEPPWEYRREHRIGDRTPSRSGSGRRPQDDTRRRFDGND